MTFSDALKTAADILSAAGIESPLNDARLLLMSCSGISVEKLYADINKEMEDGCKDAYFRLIERRRMREPLQLIIGSVCFYGYEYNVRKNVLIPRPETELLTDAAIAKVNAKDTAYVLDMCSGSGVIGITTFLERRKKGLETHLTMCDISQDAISLAAENIDKLIGKCRADGSGGYSFKGPGGTVRLISSDLFGNLSDRNKYDIIVSNPPYVRPDEIAGLSPEVRYYDPELALSGGVDNIDGLGFYREIISAAGNYLMPGGTLIFEMGAGQADAISGILNGNGFSGISVIKDFSGYDRIISGIYKEG